jgi:hypothetical protein
MCTVFCILLGIGRPSGEKIAAIADKLDLKKNVVRVWFCNQVNSSFQSFPLKGCRMSD